MTRIYLPTRYKANPIPVDEREELMNKINENKYVIPGADKLELSQLRDLVQYTDYRKKEDEEAAVKAGQQIVDKMPPKEVAKILKAFMEDQKKRKKIW